MNAQMNNEINNKVVLLLKVSDDDDNIICPCGKHIPEGTGEWGGACNVCDECWAEVCEECESYDDEEEEEDNIVVCTLCGSSVDCDNHNIYIVNNQKKGNEFQEDTCCESCWNNNKKMYKREGWEGDDLDDEESEDEEGWNCCKCKCDFKESEVEHIEEVDDAVCYTCCVKYGYSVVSQQEEKMLDANKAEYKSDEESEDDDEERETREEPPQDEDEEDTEYYGM